MHSITIWLPWKGIGQTPVLVDDHGEVMRLPLLWLVKLAKEQSSYCKLRTCAYGLSRFHDFWIQYHSQFIIDHDLGPAADKYDTDDLLRAFWKSMRDGDANLDWKTIARETAAAYFRAVNEFTDWVVEGTKAAHPNPLVERQLPWFAQLTQYARRVKTSWLSHLMPMKTEEKAVIQTRRINPNQHDAKRHPQGICKPSKVFTLDNYHKLIIHEKNARNLALWLMLGAGGLRISEPLHLFITDILFAQATTEARIILSDPRYGFVTTTVLGKEIRLTRQQFLKQKYNLTARDRLRQNDLQWVGWKGMKMHDPSEKTSEVIWLHPIYGQMMWAAHLQYMKERVKTHPNHPWYFVNMDHNVGQPLTRSNATDLLKNACERLDLPLPHNPHALRHMWGDVTANVLKMALQHIQVGLRHSSLLSTMIYTEPSPQTVRVAMQAARK